MPKKLITIYMDLAGAFLMAAAVMLFLANMGNPGLVLPQEPVFGISVRYLFWGAGLAALAVALICLFGKRIWLKLAILLWTGANLLIFQLGVYSETQHLGLGGYFGNLASSFRLPNQVSDWIVRIATCSLIVGSSFSALWLWTSDKNTLKVSCANCGGHVQFHIKAVGNKIPCPHCQKIMTLHQEGNLKISCYFCQGHIEFPPHAIGEKMPCPHCKMDITLKEPT